MPLTELEQIKQNLNIVDIIGKYVELKKSGKNYKGLCPFHNEKSPSFMVSTELQIYKCFGCQAGGDIFSFIKTIENIEFPAAVTQLAQLAGVKLQQRAFDPNYKEKKELLELTALASEFFHHILVKHPLGKKGLAYLTERRKLSLDTITKYKLGVAPNTWDMLVRFLTKKGFGPEAIFKAGLTIQKKDGKGYLDKFRGRIMFPLIDLDLSIVGFTARAIENQEPKYLNSPETAIFHKSSYIYGLDKAKSEIKKAGALVVEGTVDVLTAHQAGISNVIASLGTALTQQQLIKLQRFTNQLMLCFDPDLAGTNATLRGIELAEKAGFNVKTVLIPSDFKDLDDMLLKNQALAKVTVAQAVPIYDFFLSHTLKSFDKTTAFGKKQILADLAYKFGSISDQVVLDHYVTLAAKETGIPAELLLKAVTEYKQTGKTELAYDNQKENHPGVKPETSAESYMISLLFQSPLDLAQDLVYKLAKKDFEDSILAELFVEFRNYITGRKRKADLDAFINKLSPDVQTRAKEVALLDISFTAEPEKFDREAVTSMKRLKRERITRELTTLRDELKQAELGGNATEISELSTKVYKFSKLKKQYD